MTKYKKDVIFFQETESINTDSDLNLFDPTNEDIQLFNVVDDEIIKLSGSKLLYFKSYGETDFDEVYMESRSKTITDKPIVVYGHYDIKVIEERLDQFGITLTNDQVFVFNKDYITKKLGRLPKEKDIIQTLAQNHKYEIFEVQEDSFELYGVFHMNCAAKLLRDVEETHNSKELTTNKENIGRDY